MRQLGKEADPVVLSSFSDEHPGAHVTIPDAQLLFHSEFKRTGSDLTLIGEDGHRLVVIDYFRQEHPAALMSPDGATLSGDVVAALAGPANPGKYAGGAPSAAKAIGHVVQAEGAVTAVRNGVAIALNSGDAVLQGDVLQTGSDGVLGVAFNDGSVFKINAGSRLVLTEFSYTPNGGANTEMFELVQGSFTFVSGDVAKTGQMQIGTPASVMKVVGTSGGGDVSSANGQVTLYLFPRNDGTHTALVFDRNGNQLATLSSEGGKYVITPIGPQQVTGAELPKTDADKQFALDALASILKVKSFADQITESIPTQTPTSGSHGSSFVPSEIFLGSGQAASTSLTIVIPPATNVLPAQTAPGVQTGHDVTQPHDLPQQPPAPRALLGSDDTYTLNEDGILIVAASGVLANDTDPDGRRLSASLVAGPQHGVLTLNSDGSFSYVPVSNYNGLDSFTYVAGDGALNSGDVTVHLTVTAVNDVPVLALNAGPVSATEQVPIAVAPALTLADVDSATLAKATVRITGNYHQGEDLLSFTDTALIHGAFDAATGTLTLTARPGQTPTIADFQAALRLITYVDTRDAPSTDVRTLTVTVQDPDGTANGGQDTKVATTTLTVTPVNDAPVSAGFALAAVDEGVAAHSRVFTAAATDPDGDTLTHSLVPGGDAAAFTIDAATGIVTINASPDFETKSAYSFTVKASDASGTFTTQAVTLGVNDLAPVISSGTTANVNEAVAANTIVYTAAAADPVGGLVTYSLVVGGDASAFTIDAATGVVTINVSPDFETKPSYSFSVKASDASGAFTTQAVTLSVNDLAPVISSGATANVNEAVAANTIVYTAAAADPAGGAVTYALTGTDAPAFTIDASTGVVTINATPDFETNSSYSFSVKASDASGSFTAQAVTLNVNDLPPVITSGTTASINENVAANTAVYTAAAADPAGGAVTYALTGTDASAFTIDTSTGVVTINNTPDFETKPSYSFSVKASDASGSFTTQAVTLSINLNEPPVISGDLAIALYQGGKVVLTPADLAAADVDNSASQLTFNVTGTTRGHVALASAPATIITSFTQAQLAAGLVAFVSDGTANATASFTVTATDGAFTTAPSTVNAAVSVVPDPLNITSGTTDIHDANATINTLHQSFYGTLTGTGTLIVTGSATLADASTQSGSGTTIFRTDTTASNLANLTIDGRSLEFESDLIFTGTGGSNTTMLLNNGASLRFGSATLKVLQNKITIGTTTSGALGSVVFEDNSSLRLETFASLALNVGSVVFENNATWDLGQGASVDFNAPVSAVAHADFGQWRIGSGDVGSSVTFTKGLDLTPDLSGSTYQTDPFGHPAWYNSSEGVYWYGSWNYSGNPTTDALRYAVSGVPNVTIVGDDLVPLRAAHVTFVNSTVANDWQAIEKLTLINSSMVGGNYIDFVATKSYEVLGGTVVTIYVSSGFDYYYYDLPGNVAKLRIDDGTVFLNHQSGTVPAFRGGLDIDHNATIDATDVPIPYPAPTITLGAQSVSNWGQAGMNFTLDHLVVTTGNVDYATIHAYYGTINLNNRSQIVLTYFGTFDDGLGFAGDGLTIQSTAGSGSVINGGQWILRSSTGSGMHVNVEFNTNGGSVQLLNSQSKLTLAGGGTDVNAHYTGVGTVVFGGGTRTIDSGSDISTAKVSFTGGTTTLDGTYGVSATTVSGGAANLLGASTSLGAATISGGTLDLGGGSDAAVSLTQSGGTLTGTGTLTVSGAAAFSGGTESGSGTTIVNGAATFFTASNQSFTLDTGRVIDLKGSAQTGAFSGETIHLNGAAQLIVDTGVTFTDQGTGSGAAGFTVDGNGTLNVFGSYAKTGIGTTDISAAVVNSGTIDVQAGTMTLASVTNTGTLKAENGGTLHLTGADTGTGAVTIGHNGTVEFGGSVAAGQTITFTDTTGYLKLDAPAIFAGTIAGFSGTAPDAANSDVIELVGIDYATMTYSYVAGVLTIGDGTDSATLKFAGFGGTFVFAADADGDTLIFDPPAAPPALPPVAPASVPPPAVATGAGDGASAAPNRTGSVSIGTAGSDNFVFKPGIGAGTIFNFNSRQDTIEFDNFADVHAVEQLVSDITSDVHGNVMIGLGHGDSITIAGMTESQFHAIAQSAIHLH